MIGWIVGGVIALVGIVFISIGWQGDYSPLGRGAFMGSGAAVVALGIAVAFALNKSEQ